MSVALSGPIVLIGAGNMGGAMALGWVKSGIAGSSIIAADPNPPEPMKSRLSDGGIQFSASAPEGVTASVIFVAVKPQVMDKVLPAYKALIGKDTIVVSIAAGKTLGFLEQHLETALEALARDVPLRGFFVWSLMDNFEWAQGYEPRFGIVHVDYGTQERTIRDSGRFWAAHPFTSE